MTNIAFYETKLGAFCLEYENEWIIGIKKIKSLPKESTLKTPLTDKAFSQIEEYLSGNRKTFDFAYQLKGTPFQKKVFQALLDIPYGQTRSYKQIALAIGNEKASRAVGLANNKNPLLIVVPCHRVIGSSGKLVGYAAGLKIKQFLLDLERTPH